MIPKLVVASAIAGAISLLGVATAFADTPTPTATATTSVTSTPTKSPTPTPIPVADASAARDKLLTLALGSLNEIGTSGFEGFFKVWRQQLPGLEQDGSAIVAKSNAVSVYYNDLFSKQTRSDANPEVIAFATGDDKGGCAGAVLYGFPKISKSALVASPSPCTGEAVKEAFKLILAATPSPTASATNPSAPLPPATGSGTFDGDGRIGWPFSIMSGAACVIAGAALGFLRRGRGRIE